MFFLNFSGLAYFGGDFAKEIINAEAQSAKLDEKKRAKALAKHKQEQKSQVLASLGSTTSQGSRPIASIFVLEK